ncbi:MAG: hypothetical protein AAF664_07750 [Planctomycetota bacterium]
MSRSNFWFTLLPVALVVAFGVSAKGDSPSFFKRLLKPAGPSADPQQIYELSQSDGPFLILASTLMGEGARERANQLAIEIRQTLRLPAFIHKEAFDFTGSLGTDATGMREYKYANEYKYEAYAVLVGEYDSLRHPSIADDLQRIKAARPSVLEQEDAKEAEESTDRLPTTVKRMAAMIKAYGKEENSVGPMAKAFVTRNPLLPEDFFIAPQVDSFVMELNRELPEHNLLDTDGAFTVVVKTFYGRAAFEKKSGQADFIPNARRFKRIAMKADMMCKELRKQGVEAYQFHDRDQSIVTVGAFDILGRELPGGGFEYDPEIVAVMRKFNAYNVDPGLKQQVPAGADGFAAKNIRNIPFDPQPRAIAIPRKTKKSLYGVLTRR